jgi:flavin-dependent dehydrogenase
MALAANDADVVIVGAGPAGSALAIMLGQAGVNTTLLDRSRFPRDKTCGEGLMPAGVQVLDELGVSLARFPSLRAVSYRVPRAGSAMGEFMDGKTGRGVRRLEFDRLLAERAAATPNVDARYGCEATGVEVWPSHIEVKTAAGTLTARFAVGADGIRSRVARWVGWSRPPRGQHRYALVGHAESPAHGADWVLVTLLDGCEVYTAPTGPDELLIAVLGSKSGLRADGEPVREAYARHVRAAHPDVRIHADAAIHGAGPFWVRPSTVADRRVALIGDAAGFLDPLTGDGMSDALVAARKLAQLVASEVPDPLRAYRRWEAGQWRRRVFVNRLALTLTGSSLLARRALRRLRQRPSTLSRLLEVNDGSRSLWSLSLRDWSTLAGV